MAMQKATEGSTLGDILEKILDKGIVIAGDISISLADVELLNVKIRLVVASVDKAMEMGINWWKNDPYLSSDAMKNNLKDIEDENRKLREKIQKLQQELA